MLNWLRRLVARFVTPRIIEVDLTRPRLDPEARRSLAELKSHPGVNYIIARIRLQRWYLENHLHTRSFSALREMDQVQLGSKWLHWVERQIEDMLEVDKPKSLVASGEDLESFVIAQSALELVGQDQK